MNLESRLLGILLLGSGRSSTITYWKGLRCKCYDFSKFVL